LKFGDREDVAPMQIAVARPAPAPARTRPKSAYVFTGIRLGIATILALVALAPGRPSSLHAFGDFIFSLGAALMVAQAVSLAH
jgi:hypothetical protein